MQISIYTNFGRVYGQNHRRYQNIVEKKALKECFQQKKWNKNFHFKICKKNKQTIFYQKIKNLHFRVKSDVWAPKCEKLIEKALFTCIIKKCTFC